MEGRLGSTALLFYNWGICMEDRQWSGGLTAQNSNKVQFAENLIYHTFLIEIITEPLKRSRENFCETAGTIVSWGWNGEFLPVPVKPKSKVWGETRQVLNVFRSAPRILFLDYNILLIGFIPHTQKGVWIYNWDKTERTELSCLCMPCLFWWCWLSPRWKWFFEW